MRLAYAPRRWRGGRSIRPNLAENDQDLYLWVTARIGDGPTREAPQMLTPMLDRIARHAATRFAADR